MVVFRSELRSKHLDPVHWLKVYRSGSHRIGLGVIDPSGRGCGHGSGRTLGKGAVQRSIVTLKINLEPSSNSYSAVEMGKYLKAKGRRFGWLRMVDDRVGIKRRVHFINVRWKRGRLRRNVAWDGFE